MSSKRHQRRRSCLGKKPLDTAEQAYNMARYWSLNGNHGAQEYYKCPFGDHYHIRSVNKHGEVPIGNKPNVRGNTRKHHGRRFA